MNLWRRRKPTTCPGCGAVVMAGGNTTVKGDLSVTGDVFVQDAHVGCDAISAGSVTISNCTIYTTGSPLILNAPRAGAGFMATNFTPESQEPPELELSFGTEPLVAWRAWRLIRYEERGGFSELRIQPYSSLLPWTPRRRVEAVCTAEGTHEAPWQTCTCGIWAVPTLEEAQLLGCEVVGSVYLWGRILEFERGFRAQYAYPKDLRVSDPEAVRELERIYGIPVELVTGEAE